MRRTSLVERMLFCVGFLLLVFCTFARASVVPLGFAGNDDLMHPSGASVSYPPARAIPTPIGVVTMTFVGIVVAHRSRRRWSK
jgi:hypothetical protein